MNPLVRRLACASFLACVALLAPLASLAQDARTTTVQRAAREWLDVVDRGDYGASWKEAGAKFRLAMAQERWGAAAKSVRGPLGAVEQRSNYTTSFTKTFPGAPEGEYALVVFHTAFNKLTDSEETVTLEREADGKWRVIGYAVR